MSREDLYEKLNEVFWDVFDDEDIRVNDATTADDIEDWDSLEHINLIASVGNKADRCTSQGPQQRPQ